MFLIIYVCYLCSIIYLMRLLNINIDQPFRVDQALAHLPQCAQAVLKACFANQISILARRQNSSECLHAKNPLTRLVKIYRLPVVCPSLLCDGIGPLA